VTTARSKAKPEKPVLPRPAPELYEAARALAASAPVPAQRGALRLGTAGWGDASLSRDALFYPKQVKTPEARLRHYAEHFPLVEVDATYYALLASETVARWVAWTPPTFRFDVKAHPIFTGHPIDIRRLPADLATAVPLRDNQSRTYSNELPAELAREIERRYFDSLSPLVEAGRLTSILLQFPPWFEATRGSVRQLESLRARFPNAPFSVEFRHRSWLLPERRERVADVLRAQQFAYVVVDEPDVLRGGVPPIPLVTSGRLAIVRFHGQNQQAWSNPRATVAERFNYLYGPDELARWTTPVRQLLNEAEEVHAVFNNCVQNYAILNAKGLAALLG